MDTQRARAAWILVWTLSVVACIARAQTCPTCVPITDLGAGTYRGEQGGLYPGGANQPPAGHALALAKANAAIRPRNATGRIDPDGLIAMVALGMSNATMEFGATEVLVDARAARNARVVLVNTALGSHAIEQLNNPNEDYWTLLAARLAASGVTDQQVQVAWIKQSFNIVPTSVFPDHARAFQEQLVLLVNSAKQRFPNLRLVYVSSRIYGGYSTNPNRWEPLSYETGFAVKWLIESQITGSEPRLRHEWAGGTAPVLAWGPYIWANGSTARSDGLTWQPADFETDGVHPRDSGRQKVADLFAGVLDDAVVSGWFGGLPTSRVVMREAVADATIDSSMPGAALGGLSALRLENGRSVSLVRFDLTGLSGRVLHAKLLVRRAGSTGTASGVRGPIASTWNEASVTWNTAPAIPGTALVTLPDEDDFGGATTTWSYNVASAVQESLGGTVSLAITSEDLPGDAAQLRSRESGFAPRLVLLLDDSDVDGNGRFDAEDLYRQARSGRDVNADGVTDERDAADLESWARWFEIPDSARGR